MLVACVRRGDGREAGRKGGFLQLARADQAHALALSMESKRSSLTSLDQSLARMDTQLRQIEARRSEITEQLAAGSDPIAELEAERLI